LHTAPGIKRPSWLNEAPYGRDTAIAQLLLREAAIPSAICADSATFETVIGDETCFIIVTEEALRAADLRRLAERVGTQPSWSDLPFIVLTRRAAGRGNDPFLASLSDTLGNGREINERILRSLRGRTAFIGQKG
jgi:hypothetical protein